MPCSRAGLNLESRGLVGAHSDGSCLRSSHREGEVVVTGVSPGSFHGSLPERCGQRAVSAYGAGRVLLGGHVDGYWPGQVPLSVSWASGKHMGSGETCCEAMRRDPSLECKKEQRLGLWVVSWPPQKLHREPWKCLDVWTEMGGRRPLLCKL